MTLRELCTIRESCRNFDPDRPVPQELLKQIAETAILAPTARNEQSWHFYLCTGETAKEVAKCTHLFPGVNAFTDNCPAFIVISSEEKYVSILPGAKARDLRIADAGIASAYICLAASELGLSTCIIGAHREEALKKLLTVPKERRVHLTVAVGYSKTAPKCTPDRRPYEQSVTELD